MLSKIRFLSVSITSFVLQYLVLHISRSDGSTDAVLMRVLRDIDIMKALDGG